LTIIHPPQWIIYTIVAFLIHLVKILSKDYLIWRNFVVVNKDVEHNT